MLNWKPLEMWAYALLYGSDFDVVVDVYLYESSMALSETTLTIFLYCHINYSQTTLLFIQDSKKLEIIHRLSCISFIMI